MRTARLYKFGIGNCCIVLSMVFLVLPGMPYAADTKIEPSIRVSQLYTDNVSLSANRSERADLVTELEPSLHIDSKGKSSSINFDYKYQDRKYWYSDNNSNNTHTMDGAARTQLLKDHLLVDAGSKLVRQNADFGSVVSFDDLTTGSNRKSVLSTTAGANWVSKMGPALDLNMSQRADTANTLGTEVGDAKRDTTQFAVAGKRYPYWLPWIISYSNVITNYKLGNDSTYENLSATIGYLFSSRFSLSATGSKQRFELTDNSQNTLPRTYNSWTITARYLPTVRTDISMSYGKQIYGESREAHIKHRSRHSVLTMDYAEVITSSSFPESTSVRHDITVIHNAPDSAGASGTENTNTGSQLPNTASVKNYTYFTQQVNIGNYYFIQRKGDASLEVQRRRTQIRGTMSAASYEYIGLSSALLQRMIHVNASSDINITRRIDEKDEVSGRLLAQRIYFYSLAGHDDISVASANYKRILGSHSDVSGSYQYYVRNGGATGQSSRENRAIVSFTKVF